MKKVIIICAASAAALAASAIFVFRKCKDKKAMKFRDLYEDNDPAVCELYITEIPDCLLYGRKQNDNR